MINPNATWIDVNEYLPPVHNEKYIVRAINNSKETFYYGAYLSYCDGCKWYFIAHGDGTENLTVTHWMKEPKIISPRPAPFPMAADKDYIKNIYGNI